MQIEFTGKEIQLLLRLMKFRTFILEKALAKTEDPEMRIELQEEVSNIKRLSQYRLGDITLQGREHRAETSEEQTSE